MSQREIKFRAWDGNNMRGTGKNDWFSIRNDGFISSNNHDGFESELMQWTGLKDKNGVPIYEGDIAIWFVNEIQRTGEIYYTGQAFDMRNDVTGYGYIGWDALRGEVEVIGNIYESPELMEQDNEND